MVAFFLLKGVFINPALVEPFGLTLIEVTRFIPRLCFFTSLHAPTIYHYVWQAAAYGLPIVATKNGGPVDIVKVIKSLY